MQGLTTAGSWATKSPQRVLKVAEDRPSTPPCRPIFVDPKATCPACPLRRSRRSEIRPRRNLTAVAPPFAQRGSTHSHKHTSGNRVHNGPTPNHLRSSVVGSTTRRSSPASWTFRLDAAVAEQPRQRAHRGQIDQLRRCRHSSTALDPRGTVKVAGESCRSRGRQEGLCAADQSGHDVAGGGSLGELHERD